ncbi:major capsid protein [Psychrobacter urativorans]|uniref:major capsid protein n=1 Tax=Psychrobacter urativorans TaxID=45610 RepID=UPI001918F05D|nr:major capsid protein [Psychrobacter urativorans]
MLENQNEVQVIEEAINPPVGILMMRYLPPVTAVAAMVFASAANAAEFDLDIASVLVMIGVVVAAVTSVGLATLSLALTVKSFKYVKSAF